jgi:hypothetical protein
VALSPMDTGETRGVPYRESRSAAAIIVGVALEVIGGTRARLA